MLPGRLSRRAHLRRSLGLRRGPRPAGSAAAGRAAPRRGRGARAARVLVGEIGSRLDDRDLAIDLYSRLSPFADRLVVFGSCAVCWGSVERFLAPLATVTGELDEARAHHERALRVHGDLPANDRRGLPYRL